MVQVESRDLGGRAMPTERMEAGVTGTACESSREWRTWVVAVLLAVGACLIGASRAEAEDPADGRNPPQVEPAAPPASEVGDLASTEDPASDGGVDVARAAETNATEASAPTREPRLSETESDGQDYDPWEAFNDRMFSFNHDVVDRFVLKPAATAWDRVLTPDARQALGRAVDNIGMPRRLVNHVLQADVPGAAQELARFLLNTTVGVVGLFDVAKRAGLEKRDADTGQTLGVYGIGPGPYLVVPLLPPLTVRDAIGYGLDSLLDPLSFVAPLLASAGTTAGKTVNERSLNLALYQDVEDSVLDLYSAVRNGYLQRRQRDIEQRRREIRRSFESRPSPLPTVSRSER